MTSFNLACYNLSLLFDTRNLYLRQGLETSSEKIQSIYKEIKILYDKAVNNFNQPAEIKPKWWEHPDFQVSEEEKILFLEERNHAQKNIFNTIFSHSDIILLQEIETVQCLEFVKLLLPKNYNIFYGRDQKYDTAVIWNCERFEKLSPLDNEGIDRKFTVVLLIDKISLKYIKVASIHVPGYLLTNPEKDLPKNSQFLAGDKIVLDTLRQVQSIGDCKGDISLIGGDFNGEENPNYLQGRNYDLAHHRFKILTEIGFKRVKNEFPTAYNKDVEILNPKTKGFCILDHLLVKSTDKINIEQRVDDKFNFSLEDVTINPSDHRPLFFTVHAE